MRWQAQRDTAFPGRRIREAAFSGCFLAPSQSAVDASLCRRTPKLFDCRKQRAVYLLRSLRTWAILLTPLIVWTLPAAVHAGDSMLPDAKLTPGRIARSAQDRQRVTEEMERYVFRNYQIPWRRRPEFKVDHLIPVELGGANTIDNLWPQSLNIKPYNARRKEFLTRYLLNLIAANKMTLDQAQKEMREDWISCFVDRVGMAYLQ